ncbi:MAG: hypothetical protein ACP5JG_17900, partial [Anaerolineae bacterium]
MALALNDGARRALRHPRRRSLVWSFALVLCGWYISGTIISWPNEIAYFNEIAGPKTNRHNYLISSNLDWGQMMKELEGYLLEHASETTYLAYEHTAPYPLTADHRLPPSPDASDMRSPFHPEPGLYLLGATNLHIPSSCCDLGLDSYAYFRYAEPVDTIGGAILVYRVEPESVPHWLVQCGGYDAPLTDEAVTKGLSNASDVRRESIDCEKGWLYPTGADIPGIYAIPVGDQADIPWGGILGGASLAPVADAYASGPDGEFVRRRLAPARLSYLQPAGFIPPPFVLFETVKPAIPPDAVPLYPAPAEAVPAGAQGAHPGPLRFGEAFDLVSVATSAQAGEEGRREAATWWRVVGGLPDRPFSIMAHLVTQQGETIVVADGFDLNPGSLREGDLFVQRHVFSIPEHVDVASRTLWVRIGLYWLEDLVRWPVAGVPGADAVFAPVDQP